MQIALTLLISAQTLLAMVLGNPALPQEFKDNAINIANNAIVVAQDELKKPVEQPVQIVTQPITQPTQTTTQSLPIQSFGSIITQMDKSEIIVKLAQTLPSNQDTPFGTYIVHVRVNDSQGKTHKGDVVNLSISDNLEVNETQRVTEGTTRDKDEIGNIIVGSDYYYTFFTYSPSSTGDKVLTFTSNGLSKEFTINVK